MIEIDVNVIGYYTGLASCVYVGVLGYFVAKDVIAIIKDNNSRRKSNSSLDKFLDKK